MSLEEKAGTKENFSLLQRETELMGFKKGIGESFLIALICCFPMLVGYYFIPHGVINTDLQTLFWNAIWPGFNEEIIFLFCQFL